ncbi:MAG: hypothetical protein ACKOXB_07145 [Flavobacteriales bacterium]
MKKLLFLFLIFSIQVKAQINSDSLLGEWFICGSYSTSNFILNKSKPQECKGNDTLTTYRFYNTNTTIQTLTINLSSSTNDSTCSSRRSYWQWLGENSSTIDGKGYSIQKLSINQLEFTEIKKKKKGLLRIFGYENFSQ